MELTHARYEVAEGIAVITLDRPEQRNPLSSEMLRDLIATFTAARDDPEVRAVILTGAGDKAFCAGADLGGFGAEGGEMQKHVGRHMFVELFLLIEHLGKPVIACVNGHALAGGFGLAMACDLVVAADSAGFGTPEINVGLWPMMIMAIIGRNLPRKRAMELYMTGDRIDAARALEWGLVNRVVPLAEVRQTAAELARRLATRSPLVMSLGRNAFFAIDMLDFAASLELLHGQLTAVSLSDDAKEGVLAFLEKRPPDFRGR